MGREHSDRQGTDGPWFGTDRGLQPPDGLPGEEAAGSNIGTDQGADGSRPAAGQGAQRSANDQGWQDQLAGVEHEIKLGGTRGTTTREGPRQTHQDAPDRSLRPAKPLPREGSRRRGRCLLDHHISPPGDRDPGREERGRQLEILRQDTRRPTTGSRQRLGGHHQPIAPELARAAKADPSSEDPRVKRLLVVLESREPETVRPEDPASRGEGGRARGVPPYDAGDEVRRDSRIGVEHHENPGVPDGLGRNVAQRVPLGAAGTVPADHATVEARIADRGLREGPRPINRSIVDDHDPEPDPAVRRWELLPTEVAEQPGEVRHLVPRGDESRDRQASGSRIAG
jgi:hypothetical protein